MQNSLPAGAPLGRRSLLAAPLLALGYTGATGLVGPQSAAAAARFSQPVADVVWDAGTSQAIIWSGAAPGPQPLRLMRGDATALQHVLEIATVDGAAGFHAWQVPADLPADSTYAIALGHAPDIGLTGRFTIRSTP
ncbi:GPI anchored serine-threonine rich family protein [Streptomyces bambusae]|uniref:GPI anchored serine-threonine rich family protein n=1 Tax=Streptomyces bambusae TaxID=1550616 RepID=UPI001CFE54C5|nr:GPI anchored serine-threonine rich family protein [Streptomyces bambusae]MCB5168437.1 GPI anchored serine-threonine rich family protein [Streptomyces bambusae]